MLDPVEEPLDEVALELAAKGLLTVSLLRYRYRNQGAAKSVNRRGFRAERQGSRTMKFLSMVDMIATVGQRNCIEEPIRRCVNKSLGAFRRFWFHLACTPS